ncbi:MAG: DUF6153 family protein [Nocardioidaceae bacterium]
MDLPARPAAAVTRAVLSVLLLCGLLLMHGFDLHRTTSAGTSQMSAMSAAAASTDDGPTVRPSPAHGMGAMSLCVAVLAGAVLLLHALRRTTGGVPTRPRWAARTLPRRGRDRDPPLLTLLSVRRC